MNAAKIALLIHSVVLITSTLATFAFLSLYIVAMAEDPLYQAPVRYVSVTQTVNITVTRHWGGNILFFNEKQPFLNSITYGTDGKVKVFDHAGIFFASFNSSRIP